jgi:transmembrane 9 superfamily protein 2/4
MVMSVTIILCLLFAYVGGYASARSYKTLCGKSWMLNIVLTPFVVPGIAFGLLLALDYFLVFVDASGSIPLTTMVTQVLLWLAVSTPLSAAGALAALKKGPISVPVKTNEKPRPIPLQGRLLRPVATTLIGGIFPFVIISIELYFVFGSIWSRHIFPMFGCLLLCTTLAIICTCTVTVQMVGSMSRAGNYKWQWRSFFISGSSAFYVLAYLLVVRLGSLSQAGLVPICLYIGYSLLISFLMFVLLGSVGFVTTFFFLRNIYSNIKVE